VFEKRFGERGVARLTMPSAEPVPGTARGRPCEQDIGTEPTRRRCRRQPPGSVHVAEVHVLAEVRGVGIGVALLAEAERR
jgi:ribosomal protein S18 acetylase RimI-like enzyme